MQTTELKKVLRKRALYSIEEDLDVLLAGAVNEETGEIEIDMEALEGLEMEKAKKIEGIIKYYKDLLGDIQKFKDEIDSLSRVMNRMKNKAEGIKNYLDFAHEEKQYIEVNLKGEEKIKAKKYDYGVHQITFRKSSVVLPTMKNITGKIPKLFQKIVDPVPDKALIKAYLKVDKKVQGWEIKENLNIQIK